MDDIINKNISFLRQSFSEVNGEDLLDFSRIDCNIISIMGCDFKFLINQNPSLNYIKSIQL